MSYSFQLPTEFRTTGSDIVAESKVQRQKISQNNILASLQDRYPLTSGESWSATE